jgi:hypothetical protein
VGEAEVGVVNRDEEIARALHPSSMQPRRTPVKTGTINVTTARPCVTPVCKIPGTHCQECDRRLAWDDVLERWVHNDGNIVCFDSI